MASAPVNRNPLIPPSYQDTAPSVTVDTPLKGKSKYKFTRFSHETPASIKPRYIKDKPLRRKIKDLNPVPKHQSTQSPSERIPKKIKIPADKVQSIQETLLPVNPDVAAQKLNNRETIKNSN